MRSVIHTIIVCVVVIGLWFAYTFYLTQPATEKNTTQIALNLSDAELRWESPYRAPYILHITSASDEHFEWISKGGGPQDPIAKEVIESTQNIQFTVWRHLPTLRIGKTVNQVVTIADTEQVYYDVSQFNASQHHDRIISIEVGIFMVIIAGVNIWLKKLGAK